MTVGRESAKKKDHPARTPAPFHSFNPIPHRPLKNDDAGPTRTTTWERWNGDQMRGDPSMNSYDHYAYGVVGEWLYRYAAGVATVSSDPGFRIIYLHPNFDARLGSLFTYNSSRRS